MRTSAGSYPKSLNEAGAAVASQQLNDRSARATSGEEFPATERVIMQQYHS
jgi:hypothetical protein